MNIKIWDDRYIIRSDARQYRLIEIKEKAPDEESDDVQADENGTYEVNIGYYSSMASLFRGLVEREGRLNKCTTLEGYVKHIEKINKKLEENLLVIAAMIGKKESFDRIMYAMPDKIPDSVAKIGEAKKKLNKKLFTFI